ncbi:TolB family protein [Pontibacter chinhatensis]|uniref:WD40-like Beta Propeller Repeat n=1 Tax=Pontibacter chinhatensis TaxID=1436961 RepID=A0A1I2Y7K9_9BACT|nr:PD40 domain-containing protein [Pontibacter chinhatensis]SFH21612.1 WD40-like Beta Propeller Repeat [Pontibacter chinhatensis]
MRKAVTFFLSFLLFTLQASAQEEIGLNPPSMEWRQIDAPAGRIIFPKGLDSMAFRVAGIMAWQQRHDSSLVGTGRTKRVTTILQNQSAMPAGFSTPAPWRNELYLTPPQNLFTGPTPWLTYVTAHEYRHSQQFHMANRGAALPFKVLMGQTGWLLNALVNQPLWFREGDAVVTETALTNAGRGQLPRFHMETRALLLSGLRYGYEKFNYPSSFRDFVPNPYRLGFYMTSKARQDFGNSIWQEVLYYTHHLLPVYAFSRSLRKHTGLSPEMLYQETMQELDSLWQQTDERINLTPARVVSKPGRTNYTNYRFAHYLPDGSVIALKDALDEIRTFYRITPDGEEEKLFPYGVYTEDHIMFSGAGELITWAEAAFDERWVNQDYSIIKTYNVRTGKTKKLTSKTRYFAPASSPNGSRIVAVHIDKSGRNSIVILDAESGECLQEWPAAVGTQLAQPRWSEGNSIIALEVTEEGNRLIETDVETGITEVLLPFTDVPLSRPYPFGEYVYFSGGYTGIDNIYAFHQPTGKVYQVTSVRFGAYEPTVSPDGKKLLYSSYTARGYQLEETDLNPQLWSELPAHQVSENPFLAPLPAAEKQNLAATTFPADYQVRKYRALTDGLLNIYGWFPTFGNNQYGVEFYTRNLMSTLRGTIGTFYNTDEDALGAKVNLAYAAFYPILDVEYGLRTRRKAEIREANEADVRDQEWTERYVSAGARVPFRLTQGKYHTNLEVGGALAHYDVAFDEPDGQESSADRLDFNSFRSTLTFSRLLQRARQQVQPRWGQVARFEYQKAFEDVPERMVAGGALFFPGFGRTHSFKLRGAWKKEAVQQTYRFADDFVMPRGYKPDPFREIAVVSANYEFPVWYPDIALGPVAFLQRFRTNVFYDYSDVRLVAQQGNLNSTGAELLIDLRFLRLFSTTLVFRYNHTFESQLAETMPFQFLVTRFELAN